MKITAEISEAISPLVQIKNDHGEVIVQSANAEAFLLLLLLHKLKEIETIVSIA